GPGEPGRREDPGGRGGGPGGGASAGAHRQRGAGPGPGAGGAGRCLRGARTGLVAESGRDPGRVRTQRGGALQDPGTAAGDGQPAADRRRQGRQEAPDDPRREGEMRWPWTAPQAPPGAVQGLGAGGLVVVAFTICANVLPPRALGKIQGLGGAMYALASFGGPLLGGYFTEHVSWRWCFGINVPVGIVGLVALLV